jgi:hypothetical protein
MRWTIRARLCERCFEELERRRRRWLARPQPDPIGLRSWRLAHGLSIRALGRQTGIAPEIISRLERGTMRSSRYLERLTAAISAQ